MILISCLQHAGHSNWPCLYVSRFSALHKFTRLPPPFRHGLPSPRTVDNYPYGLGSLSPSLQQKTTKPISSVCSLHLCKTDRLSIMQQSQQETEVCSVVLKWWWKAIFSSLVEIFAVLFSRYQHASEKPENFAQREIFPLWGTSQQYVDAVPTLARYLVGSGGYRVHHWSCSCWSTNNFAGLAS